MFPSCWQHTRRYQLLGSKYRNQVFFIDMAPSVWLDYANYLFGEKDLMQIPSPLGQGKTDQVALRPCENAEHTRSGLFHLSQSRSSVWSLHCKAVADDNFQIPFYYTVQQWRTLQKHALTSVDLPKTEFSLSSSLVTEALLNSL